ncbi:tRNA-uridine aminocarboxypropyltransferase [Bowmanella sp. JS7-9]|uniref:tRNA-uridine aminocarboxypropyltransferase n=1 Tax=Pseudobowmanella zhangzhouensis TaxID=1537679 RepID=A0ABW1XPR2_9ALTE|nr:tRNA-uridine aminocarboxypropyltransferase [Bowmanella sp. JS7-9]
MPESPRRPYCPTCHYPLRVCLCDSVTRIDNNCQILILQHPSEVSVAKNTARLLALSLNHCTIAIGEQPADFQHLSIADDAVVLYPNPHSQPLSIPNAPTAPPSQLILLDGTWRKAYKLWCSNPWLHQLAIAHLDSPPPSTYQRCAKGEQQLSTLEACTYALSVLEGCDPQPLLSLLAARQRAGF